jgi:hypothetical protein
MMQRRTFVGMRAGGMLATPLIVTALAAAVRAVFVAIQGTPIHDPWRHLALIENLRRGSGLTLFDGQPYVWYTPMWHEICAVLPASIDPSWTAALFSTLAVPAFHGWLRRVEGDEAAWTARAGALLLATFGPAVAYTCHYGQEALALFLTLAGLLAVAAKSGPLIAVGGGLLLGLGLVVRLNFVFNLLLVLPSLRGRRQGAALAVGIALPLSLAWWRNHRIIASFPYVFTWDGLATRSADFGPLSTLAIPLHPAVGDALRRLHQAIIPTPQWLHGELLLFMVCGVACVLASRRWYLIVPGVLGLIYLGLFDRTLSSNFFRIYLGLFPVLLAAIAVVAGRLRALDRPWAPVAAWGLIAVTVATGARSLVPPDMVPLEMVTPPPALLTEKAYMVNSGFYQPESLVYRFPEKSFIGMPLYPAEFEDFRKHFPRYRFILWHDFSVQSELARYLERSGKVTVVARGTNAFGRLYVVLRLEGE